MLTLLLVNRFGYHSVPYPVIDPRPHVQRAYEFLRRVKGQSHRMAEMLACRQPPGLKGTDRAFNEGRCNGNQFERMPWLGDYYREIAHRHGISTTGKFYASQIANEPGDPRAWISDVGELKKVAAERDITLRGIVDYTPPERDHSAADEKLNKAFSVDGYRVADDIVEDEIFNRVADNPEMWRDLNANPQKVADLKDEISTQLSGHA